MMHYLLYFKMEKKIFQRVTTSRIRQFKECFNFRNFTRRLEIYQVEYGLIRDVGIHIEKAMKIFPAYQGENYFLHQLTEKQTYYCTLTKRKMNRTRGFGTKRSDEKYIIL